MSTPWPAGLLDAIVTADDLKVSPPRQDGRRFGTPTWIWCVRVDDDLYVRAYHGPSSRWYAAALARPDGRIHAAEQVLDVTFDPAPESLADRIDAAYRDKYAGSTYLAPMVAHGPRAACFRISPR
jgi:hypothetical protein